MNYKVLTTLDGSPSLRSKLTTPDGVEGESMHHLGGAYSETQYIYGEALRRTEDIIMTQNFSVMVVGLGLGYIELLSMGEFLKFKTNGIRSCTEFSDIEFKMVSYEIDPFLKDGFIKWIFNKLEPIHPLFEVYEEIALYLTKDGYSISEIKCHLVSAYEAKRWIIFNELNLSNLPEFKVNKLLYDAFSGFSTPLLWEEGFLNQLLNKISANHCTFSTYACKGSLKRALILNSFEFQKKKGFLGKRDSTFAIK